jgi:glyoxylase-like metal-dependent hydrolase (beta-lactamase superfamily II)
MSEFVKSFTLGDATISVINIGDIYLPMANHMNVPTSEFVGHDDLHGFMEQVHIPIQMFHIQLPHTSVLVDAGIYDVMAYPEYAIPDYTPPASLIEGLAELGIQAKDIEHVIITHRHWDHFNGTTVEENGQYIPQFPNATYYLGRPDWDRAEEDLKNPQSVEYRTLQVLQDHGILELVDGDLKIIEGVEIMATPGETRGHQIVRIDAEGHTLYCLGDLYHHAVELDHPEWAVSWARDTIFASREIFKKRAREDQAQFVATHIVGVGKFNEGGGNITWTAI